MNYDMEALWKMARLSLTRVLEALTILEGGGYERCPPLRGGGGALK